MILKIILNLKLKNFFPFEYQPFQNRLIYYLKMTNNNAKVIGYIHAPLYLFRPTIFTEE